MNCQIVNAYCVPKSQSWGSPGIQLAMKTAANELNIPLDKIEWNKDLYGKPYLTKKDGGSLPFHFNITHSGKYLTLLYDFKSTVGVDVAQIKIPGNLSFSDFFRCMQPCFTDKEWQKISTGNYSVRLKKIFSCWTQKEAFLKAIGLGLRLDLHRVEINNFEKPITCTSDQIASEISELKDGVTLDNVNLLGCSFGNYIIDNEYILSVCKLHDSGIARFVKLHGL